MKKQLLTLMIFILLIVIMTFPLVFKMNTFLPGFYSTDEIYSPVWKAWWYKFCFTNHVSSKYVNYVSYPFGMNSFHFSHIFFLINFILALLTNHFFTYNFQVIVNFLLMAFFTQLLAYVITNNRLSAFLAGVIFAFCPYTFMRSWQHLGETYLWMMPMVVWVLFSLKDNSTRLKQALLIISIVLTGIVLGTAYYTVIILSAFLSYGIVRFLMSQRFPGRLSSISLDYFKRIVFLLFIGYLLMVLHYSSYIKNSILNAHLEASAFNPYRRPFEDLFAQSAKPLSYFLPATVHPLFGRFTEQFIGTELYGDSLTEHTIYLGWTPLLLAFVAFRRWRRNKKSPSRKVAGSVQGESKQDFYIGFFVFLAVVAWLFSQPPWWDIFGFKIYMPSFFMYQILPMFRAYCRFGIVVMLAVAVLAGFGLKFILERFKGRKSKATVTALFCSLVLFEFWNYPPFKVIDLSKVPAVYYWLKEQPKDIVVAEYPLDADSPNELYKFFQTVHEKKIINGTIPGTYANKVAQEIRRLSEPKTASILKWMGVKYVLVHKEGYFKTDLIEDREDLEKVPQSAGLKFIKSFPPEECPLKDIMCVQKTGPIEVYEVTANPIEPRIENRALKKDVPDSAIVR
jgi:hypothetical protein